MAALQVGEQGEQSSVAPTGGWAEIQATHLQAGARGGQAGIDEQPAGGGAADAVEVVPQAVGREDDEDVGLVDGVAEDRVGGEEYLGGGGLESMPRKVGLGGQA